ncbi:MAG: radical SAM protein [Polyangiaceae bacterium]|nr:radical SAM protein [Polyangiaceae bacterium]
MLPDEVARVLSIDLVDARRIWSRVQKDAALPSRAPATIRRAALDRALARGPIPQLEVLDRRASSVDPFVKYAFSTNGGGAIEAVRIPLERQGRYSVCVSSQVGCALACAFCATGRMGLTRNLEVWEIVDQVRTVRADLTEGRVHGLVFQGMGEPLANVDRVIRAIRILTDPSGLAIDQRNVTVCTSGLPTGIRRIADELPSARLGISIGDARPGRRAALMPIDDAHPLDEVLEAAGAHSTRTGYAPMWAYTLLAGVNDDDDAANAFADRAIAFAERYGVRPRLSLIPYNDVEGAPFTRSAGETLERFRDVLGARGVGSIVRYSGGGDIGAACGQLVTLKTSSGRRDRRLDPSYPRS